MSITIASQNCGGDGTTASISRRLNVGHIAATSCGGSAHYLTRAVVAIDNFPGAIVCNSRPAGFSRQRNPLVIATELLFHAQMDGWPVGCDAARGLAPSDPRKVVSRHVLVHDEQRVVHRGDNEHGGQLAVRPRWQRRRGGRRRHCSVLRRHAGNPAYIRWQQRSSELAPSDVAWPVDNTAAGIVPATRSECSIKRHCDVHARQYRDLLDDCAASVTTIFALGRVVQL